MRKKAILLLLILLVIFTCTGCQKLSGYVFEFRWWLVGIVSSEEETAKVVEAERPRYYIMDNGQTWEEMQESQRGRAQGGKESTKENDGKKSTRQVTKLSGNMKGQSKKKVKVVLKWKKVKDADGYQIRYSTKASMASGKRKDVKAKTKYTLCNLDKSRTYYIQVRAYLKKNGTKEYAKWSKKISI